MEAIGTYTLIRSDEGIADRKNILGTEHLRLVEDLLKKGKKDIAISLESGLQQPHSRQISLLMQCVRLVESAAGRFAAIVPDENLRTLLNEMGLPKVISIFRSKDEMRLKVSGR